MIYDTDFHDEDEQRLQLWISVVEEVKRGDHQ